MPGHEHAQDHRACCTTRENAGPRAIDPICEMDVDRSSPPGGTLELDGETYFFCSTFCRAKFAGTKATSTELSRPAE
jgi:YHS domain-containing protein